MLLGYARTVQLGLSWDAAGTELGCSWDTHGQSNWD